MKNIFIINAHWNNRGDEAAVRAMIDELKISYPDSNINVEILFNNELLQFPYKPDYAKALEFKFPRKKTLLDYFLIYLTKGKLCFSKEGKEFLNALKSSDIVIHAPGGPSIGQIYKKAEIEYILRLLLVKRFKKDLVFYAPSMGPFENSSAIRNFFRKKILNYAKLLCVREPISQAYLEKLKLNKEVKVTLDSAFQHEVSSEDNEKKLNNDKKLKEFLDSNSKVIGITITDLEWNPKYKGNDTIKENINNTYKKFIDYLTDNGYSVIFIPQLFGESNDSEYMEKFANDQCFVLSDNYDCYFQQYIISKLYAVVGMRYHSNIFSAKMCTPFISVAYEQKMSGFMKKTNLDEYCIDISDLSFDLLKDYFDNLNKKYSDYKEKLNNMGIKLKEESYQTTKYVIDIIDRKEN